MSRPSVSEIVRELKKIRQEDDSLPNKQSILETIAREVRKSNPIPGGRCGNCARQEERIAPITMRVCRRCIDKAERRGGWVRRLQVDKMARILCDWCLKRVFNPIVIWTRLCPYCIRKMKGKYKGFQKYREKMERRDRKFREKIYNIYGNKINSAV